MRKRPTEHRSPEWSQLLVDAVQKPGVLSSAYQRFWNYSVGNQLLAIFECMRRNIEPGPIHTFKGWLGLGRYVKKGERAITLCMPVTVKRKPRKHRKPAAKKECNSKQDHPSPSSSEDETLSDIRQLFTFKPHWFVLSQTEGDPYVPTELPRWSESCALATLKIGRVVFTHPDGNCQGYAREREVAVSPIAALPHKTLFHEIAHVVLGHTTQGILDDHGRTPRSLREVEAECVALICCESLALPGAPECRGYIQHWLQGQKITDCSARKIFKATDSLLKAGYPASVARAVENSSYRESPSFA